MCGRAPRATVAISTAACAAAVVAIATSSSIPSAWLSSTTPLIAAVLMVRSRQHCRVVAASWLAGLKSVHLLFPLPCKENKKSTKKKGEDNHFLEPLRKLTHMDMYLVFFDFFLKFFSPPANPFQGTEPRASSTTFPHESRSQYSINSTNLNRSQDMRRRKESLSIRAWPGLVRGWSH